MSTLFGLAGIVFSLWFAFKNEGGGFQGYFSLGGAVLLLVGPPSIMLLSHSIMDFVTGIKLLFASMMGGRKKTHEEVIDTLTAASKAVRADGMGAVIPFRDRATYDLLRDGLSLIVNDFRPEDIRNNLTARINLKQSHLQAASNLFENMSKICPGVGMIGTLMGLIGMLSNMSDPAKIGSNMALAMITTLYGLGLGTILYAPWAEKIALQAERALELDMLVLEGVLNVKGKKSSVHLKDLMKSYTSAGKAGKADDSGKKGA